MESYAPAVLGWLTGLGSLGEAYPWTLGLLPYGRDKLDLVLQDYDVLATSNLNTSLSTMSDLVGRPKSRAMTAGPKPAVSARPLSSDAGARSHDQTRGLSIAHCLSRVQIQRPPCNRTDASQRAPLLLFCQEGRHLLLTS